VDDHRRAVHPAVRDAGVGGCHRERGDARRAEHGRRVRGQVAAAKPAAEQQALETAASKAKADVVDGTLQVDYSKADQRQNVVDEVAPTLIKQLKSGDSAANSSSSSSTSDTSFLNGAD
ncbi:hypothetical protein IAE22_32605, partial [Bacillus sp. S34]|nr:hypothetical protein [Bacillus sp. S34]